MVVQWIDSAFPLYESNFSAPVKEQTISIYFCLFYKQFKIVYVDKPNKRNDFK